MPSSQLPSHQSFRRAIHSPLPPDIRNMLRDSTSPSISSMIGENRDDAEEEASNVAGPSRLPYPLSPMHADHISLRTETSKQFEEPGFTHSPLQEPSDLLALELPPSAENDESLLEGSSFSDSFWSRPAADLSTSWDVTLNDDSLDLPVPLLSRDGKWRGNLVARSSGSDVTLDDKPQQLSSTVLPAQRAQQKQVTERKRSSSDGQSAQESFSQHTAQREAKKRDLLSTVSTKDVAETRISASDRESQTLDSQDARRSRYKGTLPVKDRESLYNTSGPSSRYPLRSRPGTELQPTTARVLRSDAGRPQGVDQAGHARSATVQSGGPDVSVRPVNRHELAQGDVRRKSPPGQKTNEPRKRARLSSFAALQNTSDKLAVVQQLLPIAVRIFPEGFPLHRKFPLFYQRYYAPTCVDEEQLQMLLPTDATERDDPELQTILRRLDNRQVGTLNETKSLLDLYTPRIVRGTGFRKEGMCPLCYEDDFERYYSMKNSAYNYHLQNAHGISASTCLPFTPPIDFMVNYRPRARSKERSEIAQGLCHVCNRYIDLQGPRTGDVKVPEIYWWKHAQSCHRTQGPPQGFDGFFMPNTWFRRICALLDQTIGYDGEIERLLAS